MLNLDPLFNPSIMGAVGQLRQWDKGMIKEEEEVLTVAFHDISFSNFVVIRDHF